MILITGDKGYIGSNLKRKYKQLGFIVKGYDIKNGKDILDYPLLERHVREAEYVYHCAAIAGIPDCERDRKYAWAVNVKGTRNVMKACLLHNVKAVLFSSFAVEGDSYYGKTKRQNEEDFKIQAVMLRLSNVYGGENFFKMKPDAFITRLSKDNPIKIWDWEQIKDYVHIDTVILKCLAARYWGNGVYKVNSGTQITVENLAKILSTIRNVPIKYKADQKEYK